jgi:hypothetical protein
MEEPGVDGLFETWWDPVTDCVTGDDSEVKVGSTEYQNLCMPFLGKSVYMS